MRVFVFGSNRAGRHGKGAALHALRMHGAVYGQGEGLQGRSYAIPTKDKNIRTLPIGEIAKHVETFKLFAIANPQLELNITRVGCGLAGYTDEDMAPLFFGSPPNCRFPTEWIKVLEGGIQK